MTGETTLSDDGALMRRLGAWARMEQQVDRLEALAAGKLSPEELAELRCRVQQSEAIADGSDAFAPLSRQLRDALLWQAMSELSADSAAHGPGQWAPPTSEIRRVDAPAAGPRTSQVGRRRG